MALAETRSLITSEVFRSNLRSIPGLQQYQEPALSQPLYRIEYTSSRPITQVNQHRAWIVAEWMTIEHFGHVTLTFRT